MSNGTRLPYSRGFSFIELTAILVICTSVAAVLAPSMGHMRSQMRGVTSEGNLAMIGQIGAMYAADNDDRVFTFTWRGGEPYIDMSTGNERISEDDQEAASRQVLNILRRHTGRISGRGKILVPSTRLMHRRYSHLVLADYLGGNIVDPMWADPADANQLRWQVDQPSDLDGYRESGVPYADSLPDEPGYDMDGNWSQNQIRQLWPFASSYQVVPHAWNQDFGNQYIPMPETPHLFQTLSGDAPLGERRFHEVRFPSAKVHMFEEFDREQAGSPYFGYDHAQSAKLMFDGSINTAMSGLANPSVSPFDYLDGNKFVWEQTYVPLDTFPVPLGGLEDETLLSQRFRWTLGGLQGIDYPQTLMRSGR